MEESSNSSASTPALPSSQLCQDNKSLLTSIAHILTTEFPEIVSLLQSSRAECADDVSDLQALLDSTVCTTLELFSSNPVVESTSATAAGDLSNQSESPPAPSPSAASWMKILVIGELQQMKGVESFTRVMQQLFGECEQVWNRDQMTNLEIVITSEGVELHLFNGCGLSLEKNLQQIMLSTFQGTICVLQAAADEIPDWMSFVLRQIMQTQASVDAIHYFVHNPTHHDLSRVCRALQDAGFVSQKENLESCENVHCFSDALCTAQAADLRQPQQHNQHRLNAVLAFKKSIFASLINAADGWMTFFNQLIPMILSQTNRLLSRTEQQCNSIHQSFQLERAMTEAFRAQVLQSRPYIDSQLHSVLQLEEKKVPTTTSTHPLSSNIGAGRMVETLLHHNYPPHFSIPANGLVPAEQHDVVQACFKSLEDAIFTSLLVEIRHMVEEIFTASHLQAMQLIGDSFSADMPSLVKIMSSCFNETRDDALSEHTYSKYICSTIQNKFHSKMQSTFKAMTQRLFGVMSHSRWGGKRRPVTSWEWKRYEAEKIVRKLQQKRSDLVDFIFKTLQEACHEKESQFREAVSSKRGTYSNDMLSRKQSRHLLMRKLALLMRLFVQAFAVQQNWLYNDCGQFQIGQLLGQGVFGPVFEYSSTTSSGQQLLSVKRVTFGENIPIGVAMEVFFSCSLSHSRILPLLGVKFERRPGLEENSILLIRPLMRYNVNRHLRQIKPTLQKRIILCLHVLEALIFLQEHGVEHSHLTMENILINTSDEAVLSGLGFLRKTSLSVNSWGSQEEPRTSTSQFGSLLWCFMEGSGRRNLPDPPPQSTFEQLSANGCFTNALFRALPHNFQLHQLLADCWREEKNPNFQQIYDKVKKILRQLE